MYTVVATYVESTAETKKPSRRLTAASFQSVPSSELKLIRHTHVIWSRVYLCTRARARPRGYCNEGIGPADFNEGLLIGGDDWQ